MVGNDDVISSSLTIMAHSGAPQMTISLHTDALGNFYVIISSAACEIPEICFSGRVSAMRPFLFPINSGNPGWISVIECSSNY